MILCLDIGNTRIKAGICREGGWHAKSAFALADVAGLRHQLQSWPRPLRAVGCNVAGTTAGRQIEAIVGEIGIAVEWVAACREQLGVRNSYEQPAQLGADRWAALIGARSLHEGACLVVSCGTATTIDVLDAAGIFQGGLILPGLDLMRSSLTAATAQLRTAAGKHAQLPRNTDDAIVSGSIEATAGAIARMFPHIAAQAGAICLLSGGGADAVAPHLHLPVRRIDFLVLEGLAHIAAA
jgi:type III pantothenate kinase